MKRAVLSSVAIVIAWTLIDALAHRMLLQSLYAENPNLWRPFAEMNTVLIAAATFILVAVFVIGYKALVFPKSLKSGLSFGGLLGLALGTASGLGTYIHSPIPPTLACGWWVLGIVKGLVAGGILGAAMSQASATPTIHLTQR
jgi:hypothetical protein